MRNLTLLMSICAIAFMASCGNASATAINSGQEYCDVGDVVHFDAVSLDVAQYEANIEIATHCPVIAYCGDAFTIQSLPDEDVGRWHNESNYTYSNAKARPHADRTDTTDFRRARDGLSFEAAV
jgi:hypothetical protein